LVSLEPPARYIIVVSNLPIDMVTSRKAKPRHACHDYIGQRVWTFDLFLAGCHTGAAKPRLVWFCYI